MLLTTIFPLCCTNGQNVVLTSPQIQFAKMNFKLSQIMQITPEEDNKRTKMIMIKEEVLGDTNGRLVISAVGITTQILLVLTCQCENVSELIDNYKSVQEHFKSAISSTGNANAAGNNPANLDQSLEQENIIQNFKTVFGFKSNGNLASEDVRPPPLLVLGTPPSSSSRTSTNTFSTRAHAQFTHALSSQQIFLICWVRGARAAGVPRLLHVNSGPPRFSCEGQAAAEDVLFHSPDLRVQPQLSASCPAAGLVAQHIAAPEEQQADVRVGRNRNFAWALHDKRKEVPSGL